MFALKGLNICSMEVYVPDNRNPLYLCGDAGPTVKVMKMKSSPKTKATEHFVPLIQTNAGKNQFNAMKAVFFMIMFYIFLSIFLNPLTCSQNV